MKGEEKLWVILNDKLETLRATNSLHEAIRVGESALEVAKRTFSTTQIELALSYEKLGLLHDQNGDRTAAKSHLVNAHRLFEGMSQPDHGALFRSARRLARICDELGEKAIEAVKSWKFRPAKDATGNPVAVRVQVEVTFQISK